MNPAKTLSVAVAAIAIAVIAVSLLTFYSAVRPAKFASKATPEQFGIRYESVALTTKDNIKLDAWYVPAKNKTNKSVIVMHGYPFDKGNVMPLTLFLQDEFNLLYFDFRYLGKSGGSYTSIGYHEQKDLEAAAKFLRSRNQSRIGAYGFSLGGAVALMEGRNSKIDAIVADSAYASLDNMLFHAYSQLGPAKTPFTAITKVLAKLLLNIDIGEVSPEKSAGNLDVPLLLIHGSQDNQIPAENAHQIKAANKDAELWIVEGANHGETRAVAGESYEKRVREFFRDSLNKGK